MVLTELKQVATVEGPVLRETVQEHHERTVPDPRVVQPDTFSGGISLLQLVVSRRGPRHDNAWSRHKR